MNATTVREPYAPGIVAQLSALGVDHAIAALVDGDLVVGYTMCHPAGPKDKRRRCECR